MKNTGGPAFPSLKETTACIWHDEDGDKKTNYEHSFVGGMTLRDWFAGQYLTGRVARDTVPSEGLLAEVAYQYADAMIAERDK